MMSSISTRTINHYVGIRSSANGSQLRRDTYNGVSYLVAPIVSAVGDLVWWPINSQTPELILASVLATHAATRNNRPIVMGHPKISGDYVSANSPQVLQDYCFGFMFNSVFDNGKIKVEAWFDPLRAKEVGPAAENVIARLEAGENVEVSEGNYVIASYESGIFNGKAYGAKWLSAVSDHLAMLDVNEIGACNNEMGCGFTPQMSASEQRNNEHHSDDALIVMELSNMSSTTPTLRAAVMSQARRPSFTGTETVKWTKPSLADYVKHLDNSSEPPTSVGMCSGELKKKIAAHTLLGDPDATSFDDLSFFPCVNPSNDKLNENALRAILGGRGSQANIDAKALASAQEIARRLLNSEFSANISASEANTMKSGNIFSRMLAKIRDSMSNNDLRWKLYKALCDIEPGVQYVDDEDVDAKTVRYVVMICYGYTWDDASEKEYHTYQRTFATDTENNVTVNDDRVELIYDDSKAWVVKPALTLPGDANLVTEPEMMPMAASDKPCECQNKNKGEPIMASTAPAVPTATVKDLASRLITSSVSPFEESDRATLEAMSEDKLKTLSEKFEEPKKEAASSVVSVVAAGATPADPNSVTITREEYTAIKAASDAHAAQIAARKAHLVSTLKTAQSGFTESDLKEMPLPTLEKLANAFSVNQPATADYSLRGVPESNVTVSAADAIKKHKPTDTWAAARASRAKLKKQSDDADAN